MKEITLEETEKFSHLTVREVMEKIESGEIGTEIREAEARAIELGLHIN
jgi:hypothetical protein